MPRKRKYRRRRYNYQPLEIDLHPNAKKAIFVVFLLALGALGILSFFKLAGQFGNILDNALAVVFGSLRLIFALSLVVLAGLVYLDKGVKLLTYVGLLLFYSSIGGLVHLLLYHKTDLITASQLGQGGGYVGLFLSYPLLQFVGFPASILITIALLIISLIIVLNSSITTVFNIIKRIVLFFFGLFKNLFQLISTARGGKIPIFNKKEINEDEEYEEDEGNEGEEEDEEEDYNDEAEYEKGKSARIPVVATNGIGALIVSKKREKVPVPLSLLTKKTGKATAGDIKTNINVIQRTFANFGIQVDMGSYNIGPTVTQYTLKPAEGIKLSRLTALSSNLALALAAQLIRIEAPIPGKSLVGVEVPNKTSAIVNLRDLLASAEFKKQKNGLTIALGKDVAGKTWIADIAKMPHLLVAGTTGSGKTVCLNTIILSLLYTNSPDDLKLILVDPKRNEFPVYNGAPHLLTPVITDVKQTINSLKWAIGEMERRFEILAKAGRRDIASYNAHSENEMPYIVIVIDELADLMVLARAEIEKCIIQLAQKSRAIGIHLVVATQRPSVDVITGLIKANISSRIAFTVNSIVDSRTILDMSGAEKLLGNGDMLFTTSTLSKPKRLQGSFVEESDPRKVTSFLNKTYGPPEYNKTVLEKQKVTLAGGVSIDAEDSDPLLEDAINTIMSAGKASCSLLQRRLSIGYNRAARVLDILEEQGVIGPVDGAKPRELLMKKEDLERQFASQEEEREIDDEEYEDEEESEEYEESYEEEIEDEENEEEDDEEEHITHNT